MVFLLVCGAACSFFIIRELDGRATNARALCELLVITADQVECFAKSGGEILRGCDPALLLACGYCGVGAPRGFLEFFENSEITDGECREIMREFAQSFGKSYKSEQVRRCKYCLGRMEARQQAIANTLPKQKKLVLTLTVALTLMLVILLI